MSTLDIVEYPQTVLRQQALPVVDFDNTLSVFVDNLFDTLYSTSGIGLSAPQVAQSLQVMVMDLSDDQSAPHVMINPQILHKAGFAIVEESCLSIPGVAANVIRSSEIRVEAQTRDGTRVVHELNGMHAVCVQHECDHLQGKLFIDRISRLRRLRFARTLSALENTFRSGKPAQAV